MILTRNSVDELGKLPVDVKDGYLRNTSRQLSNVILNIWIIFSNGSNVNAQMDFINFEFYNESLPFIAEFKNNIATVTNLGNERSNPFNPTFQLVMLLAICTIRFPGNFCSYLIGTASWGKLSWSSGVSGTYYLPSTGLMNTDPALSS